MCVISQVFLSFQYRSVRQLQRVVGEVLKFSDAFAKYQEQFLPSAVKVNLKSLLYPITNTNPLLYK
jgi:hypothetical protein